jgi:cytidylate kinase
MDGRDIGTKVMPDADIKFFVTADVGVRTQRRFDELNNNNNDLTYAKVLANLNKRDSDDVGRKINPLVKAADAIVIDNTFLSFVDQNELVFNLIKNHT